MRKLFYLAVMAVMACSCSTHGEAGVSTATSDSATHDASAGQQVAERVEEIYAAVFKVYNEEDSLRNLNLTVERDAHSRRQELCDNYCSEDWRRLVREINQIDSLYHQGELGFWEMDYWIMGQDWHNLHISDVKTLNSSTDVAQVEFKLHNLDFVKTVRVLVVNENGVWKIDNFMDDEVDVKEAMSRYVKEENKKNAK